MNLYLLTQNDNTSYDTYDACVVAAESEELARYISPSPFSFRGSWAHSADNVAVELLGKAANKSISGIILASFNAG